MDTPAEFRKHAADCKKMAKVSNDPDTKAVWKRMAERWLLCAKLAEDRESSLGNPTSGANSPDPAQDGQASDRQGRSGKLGRPFHATLRYASLTDAASAISSLLFQRTRWSDALPSAEILLIGQTFSFARSAYPPWNDSADSKILNPGTGNPRAGCHESD